MQKTILSGVVGLIVGLVIGFFVANSINRSSTVQQSTDKTSSNESIHNQTTADIKEKPKGGMLPEISGTLDKAKNEPNNFDAQIKAGDMYAKIQKFDTAVEFYEKAAQVKPQDYETIVKIGNTYFDSKQFEKAQKWYETALGKKPDDINVRTDLGITFVERANPDLNRAIKEFQTSLQINPNHEPTLYNLGYAYYKKGESDETQKILAKLEQINPKSDLIGKLKQAIQ